MAIYPPRKMKGQHVIFETVMLFSIGMAIFAFSFFAFSSYQDFFTGLAKADNLERVKEIAMLKIQEAAYSEGKVTAEVSIPTLLGGSIYSIRLSREGINVSLPGAYTFSPIPFVNSSIQLSGAVQSSKGRFIITKDEASISIS
ncbi:MAG: hypothetical protein HYX24_05965 [Candidatus Aenigmarchaeota archaeon]|nr:hypothetical protein [Candidatus Aenigmarchaeota archaeon]